MTILQLIFHTPVVGIAGSGVAQWPALVSFLAWTVLAAAVGVALHSLRELSDGRRWEDGDVGRMTPSPAGGPGVRADEVHRRAA